MAWAADRIERDARDAEPFVRQPDGLSIAKLAFVVRLNGKR
jgi:hypothetical protein